MDKKLTIQFGPNTRLKPKSQEWEGTTRQAYPLYVVVIYDGANTQFKAEINGKTILVTEDLAQIQTPQIRKALQEYQAFIEKVILTEIENNEFSMSGLGSRIKFYGSNVKEIFESRSIADIYALIRTHRRRYEGKCTDTSIFMRFIEVFDHLEKLSVYSWIFEADDEKFMDEIEDLESYPCQDNVLFVMINDELFRMLRKYSKANSL